MAAKKKAKKAGAGAVAAGKAAKSNPYLKTLAEDDDLRDNLKTAYESARTAFDRISGKGPIDALIDDKKTRNELKEAAHSLREAADTLRGAKKRKKRGGFGKLLLLTLVGGGLALALNEGLRKKALDLLFGAEEEFEYTPSTSGSGSSASTGSTNSGSSGAPASAPSGATGSS